MRVCRHGPVRVLPPTEDRERLLAVIAERNRPLKHVQWRALSLFGRPLARPRSGGARERLAESRSGAGEARATALLIQLAQAIEAKASLKGQNQLHSQGRSGFLPRKGDAVDTLACRPLEARGD
jgi:hypothetical protein